MSENSKIEWTDHTFNPWWGCAKVSPGCDHCYAERDAGRFAPGRVLWGVGAERRTFGDAHWKKPLGWNEQARREGRRIRVFCASMADVFDKDAPDGARDRLWSLIKETPHLDWQILTKRIGNASRMLPADWGNGYPNVWLGISVVNQEEVDRDIPKLLNTPARVRWLSIEPLLGPITLPRVDFHCDLCGGTGILARWPKGECYHCKGRGQIPAISTDPKFGKPSTPMRFIDWVVVGGESGPKARPMHPDWVRSLRNQCSAAGVPFLFKQWGEWQIASFENGHFNTNMASNGCVWVDVDGRQSKPSSNGLENPYAMKKVGKRAAGRTLDGVQLDGYPVLA